MAVFVPFFFFFFFRGTPFTTFPRTLAVPEFSSCLRPYLILVYLSIQALKVGLETTHASYNKSGQACLISTAVGRQRQKLTKIHNKSGPGAETEY
ncbi:hypothetical protein K438DRAFT_964840 [Mycena galopus ATCC 62051]|nr:hypothetical protein K438DRAFT_964840 [Mycena galopus ATCC 62051]